MTEDAVYVVETGSIDGSRTANARLSIYPGTLPFGRGECLEALRKTAATIAGHPAQAREALLTFASSQGTDPAISYGWKQGMPGSETHSTISVGGSTAEIKNGGVVIKDSMGRVKAVCMGGKAMVTDAQGSLRSVPAEEFSGTAIMEALSGRRETTMAMSA